MRAQINAVGEVVEVKQLDEGEMYDYISYLEKKNGGAINLAVRVEIQNRLEENPSERKIARDVLNRIRSRREADKTIIEKNRRFESAEEA